MKMLGYLQVEERDSMLQRLSILGSDGEKKALDYLMNVGRLCLQLLDSIVAEVRKARTATLDTSTIESQGTRYKQL